MCTRPLCIDGIFILSIEVMQLEVLFHFLECIMQSFT